MRGTERSALPVGCKPFPPYWEYHLVAGDITVEHKKATFIDFNYTEAYRRVVPDVRRYCMASAK